MSKKVFMLTMFLFILPLELGAIPNLLKQQGRLVDSNTNPVTGSVEVTFQIYTSPEAQSSIWSETLTVTLDDGYYTVLLGDTVPFETDTFESDDLYMGITLEDNAEFLPRNRIASVAFALYSNHSNSVTGEVVVTGTLTVGSADVINDTGEWIGPALDESKVSFSYAGSDSQGGPATDLDCTGCIAPEELGFTVSSSSDAPNVLTVQDSEGNDVYLADSTEEFTVLGSNFGSSPVMRVREATINPTGSVSETEIVTTFTDFPAGPILFSIVNTDTGKRSNQVELSVGSEIVEFETGRRWMDESYAVSCDAYRHPAEDGHTYAGDVGSGVYTIKPDPDSEPFDVYCEMAIDNGGWTLVLKAYNGDSVSFYNSAVNKTLENTTTLNETGTSLGKSDHKSKAYFTVSGEQLLAMDLNDNAHYVYGDLDTDPSSVRDNILAAQSGSWEGGANGCGNMLSNLVRSQSSTVVGSIPVTHFGLMCTDDERSGAWANHSDDSVYFGFHPQAAHGDGTRSHHSGIGKWHSDGGDDVYESSNAEYSAESAIAIFIR